MILFNNEPIICVNYGYNTAWNLTVLEALWILYIFVQVIMNQLKNDKRKYYNSQIWEIKFSWNNILQNHWKCQNSMAFPGIFPGPKRATEQRKDPLKGKYLLLQGKTKLPKFSIKIIKLKVTNFPVLFLGKCLNSRVFQCLNFYFKFQGFPGFSRAVRTLNITASTSKISSSEFSLV